MLQTIKDKLLTFWHTSETKLWAYIQGFGAIFSGALVAANGVVTTPQFEKLMGTVNPPHWVPVALAVMGVVTYVVHGHD